MIRERLLWTGPYAADLRGRAIRAIGDDPDRIWIVATPLARDQLLGLLTARRSTPAAPRVFCWDDLWTELARIHGNPPARLSVAGARAALMSAIEATRAADRLGPLSQVADLPGTRRVLRAQFAAWTSARRKLNDPPPGDDDISRASWTVYKAYRELLKRHHLEDAPGFAAWASATIGDKAFGPAPALIFLDPVAPGPAQRSILQWADRVARSVVVTLPTSGDISGDDPAIAPLRSELVDKEYEEIQFDPVTETGLAALESSLFLDEIETDPLGPIDDLAIRGGPRGDGLGFVLASEVSNAVANGTHPDDILILVRHWDDDADLAVEILRSWGMDVSGRGSRSLAREPAVSALLNAMALPARGWESRDLIRFLRNGRIQPRWGLLGRRASLTGAAATLQSTRVFRGLAAILGELDSPTFKNPKAEQAHAVIQRLASRLDGLRDASTWPEHVDRLRDVAADLGLDGVESFVDALDDHAHFVDPDQPIDFVTFAAEAEAIAREIESDPPPPRAGMIRFLTVDEAEGVSARSVFVTNLAEGSFPSRDAVSSNPGDEEGAYGEPLAFAREKLRFLRILGSAEHVTLLAPTTDAKGDSLLPAGFLDDVRRRLGLEETSSLLKRLDPVFLEHPDLARAPADARVHAIARACLERDISHLMELVRNPLHHHALRGTAAGLQVVHERLRVKSFTSYDGLLSNPRLVDKLLARFGPDHEFSPSQIESFALCPFQFYQRYVLGLTAVDDRPELRSDAAEYGERLHSLLEEVHAAVESEGPDVDLLGRVEAMIQTRMTVELDIGDTPGDVNDALRAIEEDRVRRALKSYLSEYTRYHQDEKSTPRPMHFELSFGLPRDDKARSPEYPALEIGAADNLVRLRGKIDRVDLITTPSGTAFRVIDYKSGSLPNAKEVTTHLRSVQLPLYAMVVEQHVLKNLAPESCDFGYWSVGNDGFQLVKLPKGDSWTALRSRVADAVIELTRRLRHGEFPIDPQKKDCSRSCDYKHVCRIGQIRHVHKSVEIISLS